MKNDSHVIKKIWEDPALLTPQEHMHIEQCDICKKEYMIHSKIQESIENLPEIDISPNIQALVYLIMIKPIISLWHLVLIGFMIISIPFILQIDIFNIYLNRNLINFLVLVSIFLHMLLIIILSYYIFFKHFKKIEVFSEKIDIFLQKKLMKNEK